MPFPPAADTENRCLFDSPDLADLQMQLRDQETALRMQIISLGIFESGASDAVNYATVVSNFHADRLPPLVVTPVSAAIAADPVKFNALYTSLAAASYIFDYAAVIVNGQDLLVILLRPNVPPAAPEIDNSPRLPTPQSNPGGTRQVNASSFADPADVAAFRRCKANHGSDQQCFRKGDNGIGFCGDDCTTAPPKCALPPEDWLAKWGGRRTARLKPVNVTINGKTVVCQMADTMPHRRHITNGAGIDLSPAAVAAFGLHPPLMVKAAWSWA